MKIKEVNIKSVFYHFLEVIKFNNKLSLFFLFKKKANIAKYTRSRINEEYLF
jgi:hypothetical protein